MKCEICKKKTNWNTSYGLPTFLICQSCFNKLKKENESDKILNVIFSIGKIIEDNEKGREGNNV